MQALPTRWQSAYVARTSARVLVGIALLSAGCARALQPLVTDDTATQGSGGNQIELALDRERLRASGTLQRTQTLTAVYTRGITDTLDAFVEGSRLDIRPGDGGAKAVGAGNPVIGLKWRFWHSDAHKLSFGLKPEIALGRSARSERRALASGRNAYAATLLASQEIPGGALHFNASAAHVEYELRETRAANRSSLYRLSLAPVIDVGADWKLALDVGTSTNPDRAERARMGYVELGAIWSPHEDLELAVGAIRRYGDGEARSRTLSFGLTWRFR